MVAEIIVNRLAKDLNRIFDYLVPEHMESSIKIGARVFVPFGPRNSQIEGFVIGFKKTSEFANKDIIKIEGRELSQEEVDKLVLLAPKATVNIIRDYEIVKKLQLKLNDDIHDVVKCSNPNCITNSNEPIENIFHVESKEPILLKCRYCERNMDYDDIESQF